ncbi:MAG: DsrS, partial [Thiohalomonadales bacterium]
PFEEEPRAMIESARLVLQKNLITKEIQDSLWKKGLRKNALLVGFLKTLPDTLPVDFIEHTLLKQHRQKLELKNNNVFAKSALRILSENGQAYLHTVEMVLKKPSNQDVVISLFKIIREYFSEIRPNDVVYQDIELLISDANKYIDVTATQFDDLKDIVGSNQLLLPVYKSMLILSLIDESLLTPVFSRTDAIGSLMRRKIDHIISPLLKEIVSLRNEK